jgi:hypothetical protein
MHAIGTITLALVGILDQARSRINVPDLKVEAFQAQSFKNGPSSAVGLSVYLYRTTISTARLHLPARLGADGKPLRPALPLDLYYLLSAWGKKPEIQHYILAWAMRTIADNASLSAPILNGFDPTNAPFQHDETVDFVHEPLSIPDMLSVWEVGKPNIQPSVAYVARVVPIDSHRTEPEGPPAQARLM